MIKKNFFSSILCMVLFISCVTSNNGPKESEKLIEESLIDISVKNINNLIDNGESGKALQLILSVEESQPEYPEVSELYPLALSELEKSLTNSLSEGDFRKSITLYESFKALGEDKATRSLDLVELKYKYVLQLFDSAYPAAAIAYFYDNLALKDLSEEYVSELEKRFIETGIRGPLEKIYNHSVASSRNADPETIRLLGEKTTKQDMIGGTVTVWVNRGIKIENGVGIPDRGIGSGFFIDGNGHILTNYHVISSEVDPEYEGYSRLFIKLSEESEERIPAKVVGWDRELDIALLKTEVDPRFVFSLSRDYNPQPGDRIFAIGSPGGLKNTMTSGTVSTLSRQLMALGDSLQIDVPINPGNSGGPLLNSSDEVIGVIFAGIEQFEGVNFAIPVSDVREILPELYAGGAVTHPWLGCALFERSGRLEVLYVQPGSPAEQIGLARGDILKSLNGRSFARIPEIQRFLISNDPGSLIRISWMRDDGHYTAVASLDERPESPMETALKLDAVDNLFVPFFGMEVERISGRGNKNVLYNLVDVYPGTTADEAGLSVGDSVLLRKWEVDEENKILLIQIIMKSRKAGFIESAVQIGTYLTKGFFI